MSILQEQISAFVDKAKAWGASKIKDSKQEANHQEAFDAWCNFISSLSNLSIATGAEGTDLNLQLRGIYFEAIMESYDRDIIEEFYIFVTKPTSDIPSYDTLETKEKEDAFVDRYIKRFIKQSDLKNKDFFSLDKITQRDEVKKSEHYTFFLATTLVITDKLLTPSSSSNSFEPLKKLCAQEIAKIPPAPKNLKKIEALVAIYEICFQKDLDDEKKVCKITEILQKSKKDLDHSFLQKVFNFLKKIITSIPSDKSTFKSLDSLMKSSSMLAAVEAEDPKQSSHKPGGRNK